MGEVSLWPTQNASMEEHEETSELRDSEDDHDIKNVDKLEGNSSTNCDFSYFKDKAFFLMFEDYGSHCKNIIVGLDRIVEEFSPGGWGMGTRYSLTLFKTNIADFPSLFETEFRFLILCLRHYFLV